MSERKHPHTNQFGVYVGPKKMVVDAVGAVGEEMVLGAIVRGINEPMEPWQARLERPTTHGERRSLAALFRSEGNPLATAREKAGLKPSSPRIREAGRRSRAEAATPPNRELTAEKKALVKAVVPIAPAVIAAAEILNHKSLKVDPVPQIGDGGTGPQVGNWPEEVAAAIDVTHSSDHPVFPTFGSGDGWKSSQMSPDFTRDPITPRDRAALSLVGLLVLAACAPPSGGSQPEGTGPLPVCSMDGPVNRDDPRGVGVGVYGPDLSPLTREMALREDCKPLSMDGPIVDAIHSSVVTDVAVPLGANPIEDTNIMRIVTPYDKVYYVAIAPDYRTSDGSTKKPIFADFGVDDQTIVRTPELAVLPDGTRTLTSRDLEFGIKYNTDGSVVLTSPNQEDFPIDQAEAFGVPTREPGGGVVIDARADVSPIDLTPSTGFVAAPTETPFPTQTLPSFPVVPAPSTAPTETVATAIPQATETPPNDLAIEHNPQVSVTDEFAAGQEVVNSEAAIAPQGAEIGAGLEFGPDADQFAARLLAAMRANYPNIIPYSSMPAKLAGFRSVTDTDSEANLEALKVKVYTVEEAQTPEIQALLATSDRDGNRIVMGDLTPFQEIFIYRDEGGNIIFGIGSRDASYAKTINQTFTNGNPHNALTANALATIMLYAYEHPDVISQRGSTSIAFSNPAYSTWRLETDGLLHYNDDNTGITGIPLLNVFQ